MASPLEAPATSDEINRFWFGDAPGTDLEISKAKYGFWFAKNAEVDAQIVSRFGPLIEGAATGSLDAWKETPHGHLALVILLDQFTRNAFRGDPKTFAYDPAALRFAKEAIASGADAGVRPIQRVFFYMPLMHSESLEDQELAIQLFEALAAAQAAAAEAAGGDPAAERGVYGGFAHYGRLHRDIIARFGRFPHRNAVLGRASTEEEAVFLAQPGSAF